MAFNKYTGANEAKAQLASPLSASWTTMVVKTWQGWLFPSTYPFILKHEQYDANGVVLKRSFSKCTARTGDSFTIVRNFENCPADDTAVTQTATPQEFAVDDWVFLVVSNETILDIQNEVSRLETAKVNKAGDTMTGVLGEAQGADIAAASTVNLATATWNCLNITGNTTITSFGTVTAGAVFKLTFTGTPVITYNATSLIIPTSANITATAGDTMIIRSLWSGNWKCLSYQRADWTAVWAVIPVIPVTKTTFVAWENITAWNALYISDYDTIVWNTKTAWWTATRFWWTWADPYQVKVAQSFTINSNYTNISKIELSPYKTWTPTDNVIIRIETDNAWSPSWTLVDANATLTITSWELTLSEVIITKTFTPFNLNTWTYWIVYSRSWSLDNTNHYYLTRNTPDYTWWLVKYYNWSIWTSYWDWKDTYFQIYQTSWKAYKTDASNPSKINFIWFATNTVSSWWNTIVDTSWVSATQSGLTIWSDYYLSNTPWAISTTPWTNVVNVWKAVSATWIEIDLDRVKQLWVITPTVWASPFTYQNTTWRPIILSITWWTISQVAYSRDNTNYYQTSGATNTILTLWINDYCKITYTVAPTMKVFTI